MDKDKESHSMKRALAIVALALLSSAAFGQANVRVRGTVTGLEGDVLSVKTRSGKDLKLELAPDAGVSTAKAIRLADLKPEAYVGVAALRQDDGSLVASDVHVLSPQVPSGYNGNWDLGPRMTMTNANLAGVVEAAGGKRITLRYKDGSKTILVPDGTPIVDFDKADRSALKPGETVFAAGRQEADGRLVVRVVYVSKNGVKPGF